ncbi:alpha/beta hydrolase [Mangrovactinospora gilvigrisea]|nr:alpha/beta hydrolase [Mangrovactinospora gilvigrisea]
MNPLSGTVAGVPFTALPPVSPLPPAGGAPDPAAGLVVAWHETDAPCTDAAMAAALPLADLDVWRVYLAAPLCGRRAPTGDQHAEIGRRIDADAVREYLVPVVEGAAAELPAVLAGLRARLELAENGPLCLVGGSAGGAAVLAAIVRREVPVAAAVVVNAALRAHTVVDLISPGYRWDAESEAAAARLDFVDRAAEITAAGARLLLVSGSEDYPELRRDAAALAAAVPAGTAEVAGLGHPFAPRPGLEPAPRLKEAEVLDGIAAEWLIREGGLPRRSRPS